MVDSWIPGNLGRTVISPAIVLDLIDLDSEWWKS